MPIPCFTTNSTEKGYAVKRCPTTPSLVLKAPQSLELYLLVYRFLENCLLFSVLLLRICLHRLGDIGEPWQTTTLTVLCHRPRPFRLLPAQLLQLDLRHHQHLQQARHKTRSGQARHLMLMELPKSPKDEQHGLVCPAEHARSAAMSSRVLRAAIAGGTMLSVSCKRAAGARRICMQRPQRRGTCPVPRH